MTGQDKSTPPAACMLTFPMQRQNQTNWSWAAVTSSASAYYAMPDPPNVDYTQCKLANWAFNRIDCCSTPVPPEGNRPYSLTNALTHVGVLNQVMPQPIAIGDIQAQIAAGKPIAVRIQWLDSTTGHDVVIIGYDCTGDAPVIIVKDPWDQVLTSMKLSDFPARYNAGGTWTHTYLTKPQ